jgi:CheY-like chemotaxis protein
MNTTKVLIATDNLEHIKFLGKFLASQKLNVLVATSFAQATAIIQEKEPHIILCGIDNSDLLHTQLGENFPFIYLQDDVSKSNINSYKHVLVHPFSTSVLLQKIKSLLPDKKPKVVSENKKTVMVVDDIEVNRHLIADILSEEPFVIIQSSGGKDSIGKFKKHCIDLVLLDIEMPVMDGWETMQKYIGMKLNIPVLALTAHADNGTAKRCMTSGFKGIITKPIESKILIQAIKQQLSLKDNSAEKNVKKNNLNSSKTKNTAIKGIINLSQLERVSQNNTALKNETVQKFLENITDLKKHLAKSNDDYQGAKERKDLHIFVNLVPYFCQKKIVMKAKRFETAVKNSNTLSGEINAFKQLLENIEEQLLKITF